VILAAGGCTNSELGATTPTTSAAVTTTIEPATSASTAASTSAVPQAIEPTEAEGPQPLRGTILQPGDFVTTIFEPRVHYRIERVYPLAAFQSQHTTGLQNRPNQFTSEGQGIARYRAVATHNWWLSLTTEQIMAELESIAPIEYEDPKQTTFAGFPATAIEASAPELVVLWSDRANPAAVIGAWWLEPRQRVRLIIVETPAGSLLITVQAAAEEWDDFLPIAEEILAGISFPDLEGS
jgi:hypothetical protein